MQRTILSVAYPLTEVGGDAVGGSEQILARLDRALVEAGHRSLVIAAEGSVIQGQLIASPAMPERLNNDVRDWGRRVHRQLILETLARHPVDLVHMHSLDFHHYIPAGDVPVMATLHLPIDWYPPEIFQIKRRNFHVNCVSRSQHSNCPRSALLLDPICNGVDVDRFASRETKDDFALALGRICPEKGFPLALAAAHCADTRLLLAGEVFPYEDHLEYFDREIRPLLDDRRQFIGRLRFAEKKLLLARAKCLLIPSTVAETSSLVAMEAIASGTPVIAMRRGALPEVVDHGVTGFIVDDVNGMTAALREVHRLDPETCRRVAGERFSAAATAARYLDLYSRTIAARSTGPVTNAGIAPSLNQCPVNP